MIRVPRRVTHRAIASHRKANHCTPLAAGVGFKGAIYPGHKLFKEKGLPLRVTIYTGNGRISIPAPFSHRRLDDDYITVIDNFLHAPDRPVFMGSATTMEQVNNRIS